MFLTDLWVELISGKIDRNPIFSGLSVRARRNPRKRKAYLSKRVAEASKPISGSSLDDVSSLRLRIYKSDYILSGVHDGQQERKVIAAAFDDFLGKGTVTVQDWSSAIALLKEEPGMTHYFPSLFDVDPRVTWSDHMNEALARKEKAVSEARARDARQAAAAREKAAAQAEQERQKRAKRAEIQQAIKGLKDEISRLNAMYFAETEFTEKARLMYAVESREDLVKQLETYL